MIAKHKNHLTAISFMLILIGLFAGSSMKSMFLLAATLIAGIPIILKAIQSLRMRMFSIDVLVSIAVIGAIYLQEYTESAVVTFLFLFGEYLEARTLEKTRSSLKELAEMAPQDAIVVRDGNELTIPVEEVVLGDRVLVRPGGKVPVDGSIVSGQAYLNEAAVTGESLPVRKESGEKVFGGTILDNGFIEMIAEKVGDDTTFAKILELVEEAQEAKTPAEKFLDRFAAIYTPSIVILSILVYAFTRDLKMAITFLVISCPGALVIGAPVSTVAGIGNGAKNGVLVKGGGIMDTLAKVDTVVFDKTGTLTKGKPEVTDIKTFSGFDKHELLRLAAQAETISEHHLGRTIVKEARDRGLPVTADRPYGEVVKGKGVSASIEGRSMAIGNRKLMDISNIPIPAEILEYAINREKEGDTAVFIAVDGEPAGIISIADQIREDAKEALASLQKNGIKKIVMLTGDNRHTAALAAKQLGIDHYAAELLPEDKVEYVNQLKAAGHVVSMAGDGVNDAPAIAAADIGLAMGESGTDVSIETADVVLMADKLMQFAHAYSLSKATVRNIKQNTYFAVGIVVILLTGVLFGSVHLASGMFIHEASVVLVILNAMRLLRFSPGKNKIAAGIASRSVLSR